MADLKKLLLDITSAIVNNPDSIVITEKETDANTVAFEVAVSDDDIGRVIGKNGRTANSIRLIMKAAASSAGKRTIVDIVNSDEVDAQ